MAGELLFKDDSRHYLITFDKILVGYVIRYWWLVNENIEFLSPLPSSGINLQQGVSQEK
jgi:hypothetical protein